MAMAPRNFAGQHRSDAAIHISHAMVDSHPLAALERGCGGSDQRVVYKLAKRMVLARGVEARRVIIARRRIEQFAKVNAAGAPFLDRERRVDQFGAADHLVDPAYAERR